MARKAALFALFLLIVAPAYACSPERKAAVVHQPNLSALAEAASFTFAVPVQLPTGFLQTDLSLVNGRTVRIQYDDGQRQLCLWAAPKASDDDVTMLADGMDHRTLLEMNGYAVAFYTQQGDLTGPGHALWDQSGTSYCLTGRHAAGSSRHALFHARRLRPDGEHLSGPTPPGI